ncbi:MAG: gliding motility-associated C-terminal domain-containing protein, partial [Flavitalea sp.]
MTRYALRQLYCFALLILSVLLVNETALGQATIRHTYRFKDDLKVSQPDCGPDLVPIKSSNFCTPLPAGGNFANDDIPGCNPNKRVWQNDLYTGLSYPNATGAIGANYTIQMYVKNLNWGAALSGRVRIIDFSGGTSDEGIYYSPSASPIQKCLNVAPNGNVGPCPYFSLNRYHLITITRSSATNMVDVYVDNFRFVSIPDFTNSYVGVAGRPITLYQDPQIGINCESGQANFAYAAFTNFYSEYPDVEHAFNNICDIIADNDLANFELEQPDPCNTPLTVNFNNLSTLPITALGYQWTYNWDGGTAVPSGPNQWVITYPTPGTKTVSFTVRNVACNLSITKTQDIVLSADGTVRTSITRTICSGGSAEGYTSAGTYTDTFAAANGCDSIRTLTVVIAAAIRDTIARSICEGQNFEGYDRTGRYSDTFSLAGGCDSIRVLNLTVTSVIRTTVNETICPGGSYEGYTTAGTYTNTFTSASGCDSIRTLNLTVTPEIRTTINQSICAGQSFEGYNQTGTYTDNFTSAGGCDSIRTLNLVVVQQINTTIDRTICTGQSFEGYSTSGTYSDRFTSAGGCDSVRTLNLTVTQGITSTINETICAGQSYEGYTVSGSYTDNFTTTGGCDSTRILNLTVTSAITTTISQSICRGQSFEGYSTSGTYTDRFVSSGGCDSTRILNLTVTQGITSTIYETICDGQSYAGYNVTGTYTDNFTTSGGCDSMRVLHLTVTPEIRTTINHTMCPGQSYQGYTQAGTYTDNFISAGGCDSIRVLNLTIQNAITSRVERIICPGQTVEGYAVPGTFTDTYTLPDGCDSIRTLVLTAGASAIADIGPDQTICQGDSVVLRANYPGTYRWQDGSTRETFTVKAGGTYSLEITTNCGVTRDEMVVTQISCGTNFPNAFTPNNDGKNDVFRMINPGTPESFVLQIFNRWGQKVFEGRDPYKGWDGKIGPNAPQTGTYLYNCVVIT